MTLKCVPKELVDDEVNIESYDGLVSWGNKPLRDPIWIQIKNAIWYHNATSQPNYMFSFTIIIISDDAQWNLAME